MALFDFSYLLEVFLRRRVLLLWKSPKRLLQNAKILTAKLFLRLSIPMVEYVEYLKHFVETDNAANVPPPTGTSFLNLPYELREMIYAYLLVHSHMIRPDPANHMLRYFSFSEAELERERRYNKTVGKNLGLLRVSRQISDEALAVLYGRNNFRFSDDLDSYETRERYHNTSANDITDNMEFWLLKIGSSNRKRLRSFQVKTTGPWFDAGGHSSRNYDREYDDVEDDIEDDEISDSESDSSITDADITADTINAWNKGFTRSMDLLSAGHNLRSLSIIIAGSLHPYSPIYVHVFRTWNSVTVEALSRITGLKEFKVLGGDSPRSERPWDDDSRLDRILSDEQIEKEVLEVANIPYVQGAGGWKARLGPDKSQWHHVIREEIDSRKNGRRMDIVELRSNQLVRDMRAIMVA